MSTRRNTLYFAYGSNLDADQMRRRCPSAELVTTATLPGHRLAFGGQSRGWGGGVATVQGDLADSVPGAVYRISIADLVALDGYEGHPSVYRREEMTVRTASGQTAIVWIYILEPQFNRCAPSMRYLNTIAQGYRACGFDTKALRRHYRGVAVTGEETRRIFVYGTLLRGEPNARLLGGRGARYEGNARTLPAFRMVDLGAFPAVAAGGTTAIVGEVYVCSVATVARLDRLEGHPSFYRRTEITLDDGTFAQTYLLPDVDRHDLIESGSWRKHLETS